MGAESDLARRERPGDAGLIARILHDFNTEFDTDSPGPVVLQARLQVLLAESETLALLDSRPETGLALGTLGPSVW